MGKIWSKPRDRTPYGEEFVFIASTSDWCLKYEGSNSYGLCVGIDISSRNGSIQDWDDTAAKSATLVKEAIAGSIIPNDQIQDHSLENGTNLYTKKALRDLIIRNASKVQTGGIFIFYFSGYAFLHNDEWVLAVANYSEVSTGITANELMEWITTPECKACHVLIVLDCRCAGRFGEKLIAQVQANPYKRASNQEVHVMCSCSTAEELPPVKMLGGSIFSYFLSRTLKQHSSKTDFDIKRSMDEVTNLCCSFSTLMLNYTERDGLTSVKIHPSMVSSLNHKLWKPNFDRKDDVYDGNNQCPNLQPLYNLCDNPDLPELHPEVIKWLTSMEIQESLKALHSNALLPTPLLDGVFSALLYSITCMHLEHDHTHKSERNLFVVAAIIVVLVLQESGHPEMNITRDLIRNGLECYYKPLSLNAVSAKPIEELIIKLSL